MEREREEQLYRLQADLCRVLAEPTRLKLLSLLGEGPHAVKDLVEATGERQAKISQHLHILHGPACTTIWRSNSSTGPIGISCRRGWYETRLTPLVSMRALTAKSSHAPGWRYPHRIPQSPKLACEGLTYLLTSDVGGRSPLVGHTIPQMASLSGRQGTGCLRKNTLMQMI